MAKKKKEKIGNIKLADSFSVAIIVFLSAVFVIEALVAGIDTDFGLSGLIIFLALLITILNLVNVINLDGATLNVPIFLLLFYTLLMSYNGWQYSHFLFATLVFCVISCIYGNFARSVGFVIVQNLFIGVLVLTGTPISGEGVYTLVTLVSWAICIFSSIIVLIITRSATVSLAKALEHQASFSDLLNSTENYIAMIDQRNEVVYASKTLAMLAETEEPELVQGRSLLDLFPGKTLKLYAGKMLSQKEEYTDDWEFTLDGQKRYFKAASYKLTGETSGSLINLYDMTHLAERDEIAAMRDAMQIGLFFMDQKYVIQDHYSRYLEEMLSEEDLMGKLFTDILTNSLSATELEGVKDYLEMVIEQTHDKEMLDDINPLSEFKYVSPKTGERKVLQCAFSTMDRGHDIFFLVTMYDITARFELQQRVDEEEAKRHEEMQALFELVRVDPDVFNDFKADMEQEFESIDKILKDTELSTKEVLIKVYQNIHAIKSNAVILGLSIFGNKVHAFESKIKMMRESETEISFNEKLNLAMDIERLSQEREHFEEIINNFQTYRGTDNKGGNGPVKVLVNALEKAAAKVAEDMDKLVQVDVRQVDPRAVAKSPRRFIKEILIQMVRNSVVHGIESPEDRAAKGKNETGVIKLSIKLDETHKNVHVRLSDDGKGLDYKKISEKAIKSKVIKPEDANDKNALIKAIFAPGFSTAETDDLHGGRGIGLNLVRDHIKEANGNIKVRSETDKGTLFFISVPVSSGDQQ